MLLLISLFTKAGNCMRCKALKAAFPHTLPILAGFSCIYPMFMSTLIFGGSLEFLAVEMLLSPFAPVQVIILTLLVQARHLFYGISMPEDVDRGWFMFFVTLLNQFYRVASATLGGLIGSLLKFDTSGISFVMTAMFVVIFLEQWMKEKTHVSCRLPFSACSSCTACGMFPYFRAATAARTIHLTENRKSSN